MYSLAPDHLWHLSLQPKGTGQVALRFGAALAPEVMEYQPNIKGFIKKMKDFLREVNNEDRFIVEGLRAGMELSFAKPGPLCWLEREGHEFADYLARTIKVR
ncbi:MAG: SRPBCC family protein [Candidatus Zeuxoniibacter abyssi]|nr:MAG: SRPBCC family protein [Candidatus Persebacteraceae bacterium AB1(2)]